MVSVMTMPAIFVGSTTRIYTLTCETDEVQMMMAIHLAAMVMMRDRRHEQHYECSHTHQYFRDPRLHNSTKIVIFREFPWQR